MNVKILTKGVLGCFILLFVLNSIFALVLSSTNLNDTIIKPVLIAITFLVVSINSFFVLRKIKSKGYIYGIIIGIIYSVIVFFISFVLNKNINFSVYSYLQIITSIIGGMLGGILSVNIK